MSRVTTRKLLRDAIIADITANIDAGLASVQVVSGFSGSTIDETSFRVTTATATPQVAGELNLGRWDITATIAAVSQIDTTTPDEHDDMAGVVEAYCLQGNKVLAAALSDATLLVDNVIIGQAQELAIESMRYSSQEIMCECYLKA